MSLVPAVVHFLFSFVILAGTFLLKEVYECDLCDADVSMAVCERMECGTLLSFSEVVLVRPAWPMYVQNVSVGPPERASSQYL